MRHVYIRSIIGVILAGAAIVGGGPLCIILSILFLVSAFTTWKKQQDDRKGKYCRIFRWSFWSMRWWG